LVAEVTGYHGRIVLDPSYPDGTPQKLLDVSKLTALGWQAKTSLKDGLRQTYDWFCRSPWAGEA
jgi:GDP-L-fucose synthase